MKQQFLMMCLSAFFGALIAVILVAPSPSEAETKRMAGLFEIYNNMKQRVAILGTGNEQQGSMFLFNEGGKPTHQMGTYGAGSEKGQSLFGMHDRNGHLRYLLRLHGPNDSPVLVMKDKAGQDKIVIGLEGPEETPYFKYVDPNGRVINLMKPAY